MPRYKNNIPAQSPPTHVRGQSGFQLIEILVSVVVSSIMMSAVMGQLMESQRFTTSTRNQVMASDIIQEIVDNTRNLSWADLTDATILGMHTLRVNQLTAGQAGDVFFPRALIQDQVNLNYSAAGQLDLFRADTENNGIVQAQLLNLNNGSVQLDILVRWREGAVSRTATGRTIISQTGIHN